MPAYFGSVPLVTVAELQNLVSTYNRVGFGGAVSANASAADLVVPGNKNVGVGKKAGTRVAIDGGSGVFAGYAVALGALSSSLWKLVDGSTTYTPVNIVDVGGGAGWTLTTATYAAGVLTSATAAAINATQTVALKAGRYKIQGTVGRRVSTVWPTLKVTQVTGTVVLLDAAYSTATLSAGSTVVDQLTDTFVLPADGNVKFDLNVKDVSGNQVGATFISFILEANG